MLFDVDNEMGKKGENKQEKTALKWVNRVIYTHVIQVESERENCEK